MGVHVFSYYRSGSLLGVFTVTFCNACDSMIRYVVFVTSIPHPECTTISGEVQESLLEREPGSQRCLVCHESVSHRPEAKVSAPEGEMDEADPGRTRLEAPLPSLLFDPGTAEIRND